MKIQRINTYTTSNNLDCCKPKPKNINFGFGEDYGPDPCMEPEFNRSPKDPSTLKSLWLMVEIPAVCIKEALEDALNDYKAAKHYKAMFKEQDRLKKEAEQQKPVEEKPPIIDNEDNEDSLKITA